jgi:heme-degrading monooxygenase HmoA
MWARVSRFQFPAAEVEKVIDRFNDAVDAFAAPPGLRRTDVLLSRKSGAGMAITVWDTREAMDASSEEADRLREEIALELIGWIQSVEEYEVVRSDQH